MQHERQPITGQSVTKLPVAKKLAPGSRGAVKLSESHGDALVCVRHRIDTAARVRHITVELLVESARIRPRTERIVGVRVSASERELQSLVRLAGGNWDWRARVWRISKRAVNALGLGNRIVAEK